MDAVKALAEQKNWEAAHQWFQAIPLMHRGVDLGDMMTYDVLRVLGRLTQADLQQKETADAEQQADPAA
jgi:hypothetical protein